MLILDKDARLCAEYTPKSLAFHFLDELIEGTKLAYSSIDTDNLGNTSAEYICRDLRKKFSNVLWYNRYVKYLSKLINDSTDLDVSSDEYTIDTKKVNFNHFQDCSCSVQLHNPAMSDSFIHLFNEDYPRDNVDSSRVILIKLQPTNDEFFYGVPEWFKEIQSDVYVGYDSSSHKHIKIEKGLNKYRYYTSFVSDNWQEITDVPRDIDFIIDHLLLNKR